EPDLHFKPDVGLDNLIKDPEELTNVPDEEPEFVLMLTERMHQFIKRSVSETGRRNPMYTILNWHGHGHGSFQSSEEAYQTMYIGSIDTAQQLQAKEKENS